MACSRSSSPSWCSSSKCAVAFYILERRIIRTQGDRGRLARALGDDFKGKVSPLLYLAGIVSAWLIEPWIGVTIFVGTALMWVVPDRQIEREVAQQTGED